MIPPLTHSSGARQSMRYSVCACRLLSFMFWVWWVLLLLLLRLLLLLLLLPLLLLLLRLLLLLQLVLRFRSPPLRAQLRPKHVVE